jgi:hypothetical protein
MEKYKVLSPRTPIDCVDQPRKYVESTNNFVRRPLHQAQVVVEVDTSPGAKISGKPFLLNKFVYYSRLESFGYCKLIRWIFQLVVEEFKARDDRGRHGPTSDKRHYLGRVASTPPRLGYTIIGLSLNSFKTEV